jgi:hypothetical protein
MREIEAHNVMGKEIVTHETMEERRQGYVHGLKPPRSEVCAPEVQPAGGDAVVLGKFRVLQRLGTESAVLWILRGNRDAPAQSGQPRRLTGGR